MSVLFDFYNVKFARRFLPHSRTHHPSEDAFFPLASGASLFCGIERFSKKCFQRQGSRAARRGPTARKGSGARVRSAPTRGRGTASPGGCAPRRRRRSALCCARCASRPRRRRDPRRFRARRAVRSPAQAEGAALRFVVQRFPFGQQRQQAFPGHRGVGRPLHVGRRQKRRRQVDLVDGTRSPAPALDLLAPAHRQRDEHAVFVERGLRAGERHPVVRGDDDDGLLQLALFFQERE